MFMPTEETMSRETWRGCTHYTENDNITAHCLKRKTIDFSSNVSAVQPQMLAWLTAIGLY